MLIEEFEPNQGIQWGAKTMRLTDARCWDIVEEVLLPKYTIYACLSEHISEGFVWLQKKELPNRGIVKILNEKSGKSIFCEALEIEQNFLNKYNAESSRRIKIKDPESSIVLNGWYRVRLGDISTKCQYPLQICSANTPYGQIRACMQHPQVVVRVAVCLGILSLFLGVLGVLIGIIA